MDINSDIISHKNLEVTLRHKIMVLTNREACDDRNKLI